MVELRAVTEENIRQCLAMDAGVKNKDFADTVDYSLEEAREFGEDGHLLVIYAHGQPVGFASVYTGEENCQIINFLIDKAHQGKGYGSRAAKLCIEFLRKHYNAQRISVPVALEHTTALAFWKKLGFTPSDTVEDGYVFLRLT